MTLGLLFVAACLTGATADRAACTCIPIPPLTSTAAVNQVADGFDAILEGTVLSVVELADSASIRQRRIPRWYTRLATIQVHRRWKGAAEDNVVVESDPQTTTPPPTAETHRIVLTGWVYATAGDTAGVGSPAAKVRVAVHQAGRPEPLATTEAAEDGFYRVAFTGTAGDYLLTFARIGLVEEVRRVRITGEESISVSVCMFAATIRDVLVPTGRETFTHGRPFRDTVDVVRTGPGLDLPKCTGEVRWIAR